jgi:hypothetical protein
VADWTRYLLVSHGDENRIQLAAQELSKLGFEVMVMDGVALEPGQSVAEIAPVRRIPPTEPGPLSLVGNDAELSSGPVRIDVPGRRLYVGSELIDVTTSEFSLCEYLMRNRNRVIDKPELMRHLRGSDQYSPNVIEAIVSTLRRKLGADASAMIETVRGVGYIVRSDTVPT